MLENIILIWQENAQTFKLLNTLQVHNLNKKLIRAILYFLDANMERQELKDLLQIANLVINFIYLDHVGIILRNKKN